MSASARSLRPALLLTLAPLLAGACGADERHGGDATGGLVGNGGSVPTGSGGAPPASGGSPAFGGAAPTGGSPSAGGSAGVSGSAAGGSTGGMAVGGSGGGGAPSSGGAPASGGATDTGGAPPLAGAGGTVAGAGGASAGAAGAPPEGGQAGGAGEPQSSECPSELVGWAGVSGDGVNTTTGGGDATPVRPESADALLELASDDTPRVIEIDRAFDVPRLQVGSNKTLVGVGDDAVIRGGVRIRGKSGAPVSNVILKNLRIDGATSDVDGDAVQIYFAHHVWVDHCEIWDGPDGSLDIVHASNWVTVSWTKFRYTSQAPDPDHNFAMLIGHSDNNADEDEGRLNVSVHHNHWGEGVIERMPRVRFGQVHVFNNYFASSGNNYCVRAGRGARILIENNAFDGVKDPHVFNNADDEKTAHITARNNDYSGASGTQATGGGGTPFTNAPYPVSLDDADAVPALVKACAGPR